MGRHYPLVFRYPNPDVVKPAVVAAKSTHWVTPQGCFHGGAGVGLPHPCRVVHSRFWVRTCNEVRIVFDAVWSALTSISRNSGW